MTAPNDEFSRSLTKSKMAEFLELARTRTGSVGALLELGRANLWRIESCSADEWGAHIHVKNLPLPGFTPSRNDSTELDAAWDSFHGDEGRWQMQYGWKFLFGTDEIDSVIAAGAAAAARSLTLTASHVLVIFRWRANLQSRIDGNLGEVDFSAFLDSIFQSIPQLPPLPPM